MFRTASAAFLVFFSACSATGVSGTSTSSSSSGGCSDALPDWPALLAASCGAEERCASTRGRSYSTRQACLASFSSNLVALYNTYYAPVSSADFAACMAQVESADCAEPQGGAGSPECRRAFRPRTYLFNPDCNTCDVTSQYCGEPATYAGCGPSCRPRKALGATCDFDSECASNRCWSREGQEDICSDGSELKGRGQACTGQADCLGALVCTGTPASTCQERVGLGATCGSGMAECYVDLACTEGRCMARTTDGGTCTSGAQCASGVCNTSTGACVSASVCE